MPHATRRAFLGASLAGLASGRLLRGELPLHGQADPLLPPSTLFLTWQRDPTTTMTIQWVGPRLDPADREIHYALAAAARSAPVPAEPWGHQPAEARPYPLSDLNVFRCELAGLQPGTDYLFRIGQRPAAHRFRTMPAKASDTISFISGGDCGINAHAVANNIQAARQDPMFALIGGDLGYDNGQSVEVSLAFLRNYSQHMVARDGRLIPMLACIGNHEVNGGYNQPRTKAPFFYALFDGLFPDTGFASLDFGDYLSLVLLDTGHTTPIAGQQTDWLERTLKERADHPHVFVANHVPAYPSCRKLDAGTGEGNRRHWVPLFERYRVPAVLEHHDHTFKRTRPLLGGRADVNGVVYLGDGSWGQLRLPQSPDRLPFLATSSGDYHLSLHRLQGDERFHLALNEAGKVMDVCRTGQRASG